MSFSLNIWNEESKLVVSEDSFTMRVVYSQVLNPSTFGAKYIDIVIAGITPTNSAAFVTPIGVVDGDRDAQCEPQVLNGVVRVWRTLRGDPFGTSTYSITPQRLIVCRTS